MENTNELILLISRDGFSMEYVFPDIHRNEKFPVRVQKQKNKRVSLDLDLHHSISRHYATFQKSKFVQLETLQSLEQQGTKQAYYA